MTSAEVLEQLQEDIAAVLAATPALADAKILVDNQGDIEARVESALGSLEPGPTGLSGLILIVLLPEVEDAETNLPGPPLSAICEIQVIEDPLVNRMDGGTSIRSSSAAVLALNALHHYVSGGRLLVAGKPPIKPFRTRPGTVSHVVTMNCRLAGLNGSDRPGACDAAWMEDDTLRIRCATVSAAIWYTTDFSYPSPVNPEAILYAGPISGLADGTIIRAAGWVDGQAPGDVLQVTVSAGQGDSGPTWNGWGPAWDEL